MTPDAMARLELARRYEDLIARDARSLAQATAANSGDGDDAEFLKALHGLTERLLRGLRGLTAPATPTHRSERK